MWARERPAAVVLLFLQKVCVAFSFLYLKKKVKDAFNICVYFEAVAF